MAKIYGYSISANVHCWTLEEREEAIEEINGELHLARPAWNRYTVDESEEHGGYFCADLAIGRRFRNSENDASPVLPFPAPVPGPARSQEELDKLRDVVIVLHSSKLLHENLAQAGGAKTDAGIYYPEALLLNASLIGHAMRTLTKLIEEALKNNPELK